MTSYDKNGFFYSPGPWVDGLTQIDPLIVPFSIKIPYIFLSKEMLNWQNQHCQR